MGKTSDLFKKNQHGMGVSRATKEFKENANDITKKASKGGNGSGGKKTPPEKAKATLTPKPTKKGPKPGL